METIDNLNHLKKCSAEFCPNPLLFRLYFERREDLLTEADFENIQQAVMECKECIKEFNRLKIVSRPK